MPFNQCFCLDRLIWVAIAIIAGGIIVTPVFSSFVIDWASLAKPALACFVMTAGSMFYRRIRCDEGLADALGGATQIIAFALVAAPLSYLAASAAFPLQDAQLAALDSKLGFDWMAWLAFMNAHPTVHAVTVVGYGSFIFQATAVVIALGMAKQALHLRKFVLTFIVVTLVVIAVSAVLPAQGEWGFRHLSLSDSPNVLPTVRDLPLPIFFGLRDGTYRQLVAETAAGVISFPSLHAALGLLFILALWPVKYVRWIALALNIVLILATPVEGSHYLSDVIAGLIITLTGWLAVRTTLLPRSAASPVTFPLSIEPAE